MPAPLLETKLYVPRTHRGLVDRPRLNDRLEHGAASRVMLLSAPAGFGKTTLLTEWLATRPAATAWVSLDRGDNDPTSFWTYVIAALRRVVPSIGADELALLASPQPPPIELLLTTLINELGESGRDLVLVLDDYHCIGAREIHDAVAFLIDRMPPRLHVVMASRADPAMPLARLRARGELVEIRAAELRFTAAEAAAYLNDVMGLRLTPHDVAVLEERTEGWIAALQLAALSMQGRDDVTGFIAGFAGDDRYIVDYLVEEVLQRQPPVVRDFLLQTCVLDRLSGSLCDAVTGTSGGRARLEDLDRGNLFLVPLDDQRQWYRYHHLFADVLRARLPEQPPGFVGALHQRASDWYARAGEPFEAIRHALDGELFDRAADLFEMALPAMRRERKEAKLREWLGILPDEILQLRPVLSNAYAGALLATGEVEGVERRLRDAERWLDEPERGTSEMVVVNHDEFRQVPAGVAVHRAGLALMSGDTSMTVAEARRALTLLEEGDDLLRGAATALIGLASWYGGDLETARRVYSESLVSMQSAGHVPDLMGCSIALADIQITQGRLRDAGRTYEKALLLAEQDGPALRGTADMYVGLSAIHLERNDLPSARRLLTQSEELGEHSGLPQNAYRWKAAMASLRAAEGDLDAAVDLIDQAERAYVGDFSPDVRPVPAQRARLWIRQGRVADAVDWARDQGLSVDDELSYLHEHEHVTLARMLLARGETDEVIDLLTRLLDAAEAGHRTGSVIEILVMLALAHQAGGNVEAASEQLERALVLAEPEGHVRIFVDEGPAMITLLTSVVRREIAPEHATRLLAACTGTDGPAPVGPGPIVPLSQRELDVLRLLRSELSGPEIARELVVSLNTVRTHTRNIYAKLGASNRRAAVSRAAELDL